MFQYCLNNPIVYSDPFGTSAHNAAQPWLCTCASCMGYDRFVGIGAQLELDVGSYECGIEVIVYFDSTVCNGEQPIVSVYVYEGATVDLLDLYTNPNLINTIEVMTAALATNICSEAYGKAELIQLQSLLFADANVSASVLGIYGYSNFISPEDYEGAFSTFSAAALRGKVTYSYSPSCWVIGVGASTSKKFSFGFGQTNYRLIA